MSEYTKYNDLTEEEKKCSAEGCESEAVYYIKIRDQAGHIHDCVPHFIDVREVCDVERYGYLVSTLGCPFFHGKTWVEDVKLREVIVVQPHTFG